MLTRSFPTIPDRIPVRRGGSCSGDIRLLRCKLCREIVPGSWCVTRAAMRPAVDHLLDVHLDALLSRTLPRVPFTDCGIGPTWNAMDEISTRKVA